MMKTGFRIARNLAASSIAMLVGTVSAFAQQPPANPGTPPPTPPPAVQEISLLKPQLYVISGEGGNVLVRVTPAGLILVDTKNAGDAIYARTLAAIRTVTDQPVKIVIDTHHHGDHSGNTRRYLASGAQVIGHANMPAHMTAPAPAGREAAAPPGTLYSGDSTTVELGGAKAIVYHLGNGHTDGDSVVYFPDLKTVHTGDLYVTITPFVDYNGGGTLLGTRTAITKLLELDFDTVVPGHNVNTATRAQIERYKSDLDKFIARATALIKAGTPKEELVAKIDGSDLNWSLTTRQWGSPEAVSKIYDELSAASR